MRWFLFCLVLLIPAAFVLDRETSSSSSATTTSSHDYTLRQGDVIHVPAAATRCVASAEGGFPNLFCERSPQGRYEFVFYKDSVTVWGPGGPDKPTASYQWQP